MSAEDAVESVIEFLLDDEEVCTAFEPMELRQFSQLFGKRRPSSSSLKKMYSEYQRRLDSVKDNTREIINDRWGGCGEHAIERDERMHQIQKDSFQVQERALTRDIEDLKRESQGAFARLQKKVNLIQQIHQGADLPILTSLHSHV